MFCRPKFRGEVEMPVLLGNDDPAHSVTILDQVQVDQEDFQMFKHLTIPDQEGKAIEWNGEVCLSFATNACLECVFVVLFLFLFFFVFCV